MSERTWVFTILGSVKVKVAAVDFPDALIKLAMNSRLDLEHANSITWTETVADKPNCYQCKHRRSIPGSCHSECANMTAKVEANEHGIKNGWFFWPFNYDPTWLQKCDSFQQKQI